MRDLPYLYSLAEPELPFRKFAEAGVELWNRASRAYEKAGSPLGPADKGDNVTRWLQRKIEVANHIHAAEELLGLDE